jgi:hypothetical protein
MNPTKGRQRRWLLALGGAALAVATSGCSVLIHHAYQTAGHDWTEIAALQTREEVHEKLGKPADAFTCPDGTSLDSYHLREKMEPCPTLECQPSRAARTYAGIILYDVVTLGFMEAIFTSAMIIAGESRDKLHVGFVYDAEGRVLSRYDAAPGDLAGLVLHPLTEEVVRVRWDACAGSQSCLADEVAAMRRRATCTGYILTPEEAQQVEWVERIAAEVDAGRLTREAGQDTLNACYLSASGPCPLAEGPRPPAPSGAEQP